MSRHAELLEHRGQHEQRAVAVLKCAVAWEPEARVIGELRSADLVALVAPLIHTCPACGSTAWVNIDCALCTICHDIVKADDDPASPCMCSAPESK